MWYDYGEIGKAKTDVTENFDAKAAKELTQDYYDTLRRNALFNALKQICVKASAGQSICEDIQVPIKHGDYVVTELEIRGFEVETVTINNSYHIIDVSWEEKEDDLNEC